MKKQCVTLLVSLGFAVAVLLSVVLDVRAGCEMTAREAYNPTGWEGCSTYGEGLATRWPGEGVARNDCLWPWTACQPIRITSRDTGRSIIVRPKMFCDCWTRTVRQKLVDLDRRTLAELGLPWDRGVYRVRVTPVSQVVALPDTRAAIIACLDGRTHPLAYPAFSRLHAHGRAYYGPCS